METVLKTVVVQATASSNLALSAVPRGFNPRGFLLSSRKRAIGFRPTCHAIGFRRTHREIGFRATYHVLSDLGNPVARIP